MTASLSKRLTTLTTAEPVSISIRPQTAPTQPYQVQPGQSLEVQVVIENCSDQIDHFHLVCNDLPEHYFTIWYPDSENRAQEGMTSPHLELRPGDSGLIFVEIHPPVHAPMGSYGPILRVESAHHPKLGPGEIVYFQIPPIYDLEVTLNPVPDQNKQGMGVFQVGLINQGNVERELMLRGKNLGQDSCQFTLDPPCVRLVPGTKTYVDLRVKSTGDGFAPHAKGAHELSFTIDLQDLKGLDLPQTLPHAKFEPEPYARVQGLFPLLERLLLAGGGLVAIALLTWQFFFKPPVEIAGTEPPQQPANIGGAILAEPEPSILPEITKFFSPKPVYKQRGINPPVLGSPLAPTALGMPAGGTVLLTWEMSNPSQIKELRLTAAADNGVLPNSLQRYRFQNGKLPDTLSQFCTLEQNLICRNVPTNAREPGNYTFTLRVVPSHDSAGPHPSKSIANIQIESQGSKIAESDRNPNASPGSEVSTVGGAPELLPLEMSSGRAGGDPAAAANASSLNRSGRPNLTRFAPPRRPKRTVTAPRNRASPPRPATPSNPTRAVRRSSPSPAVVQPLSQPPTARATHTRPAQGVPRSIDDANAVMRGLVKARTNGQINPHTRVWRKTQDAVYLLRRGKTREQAAQRSGVSPQVLDQLVKWGQRESPPAPTVSQPASPTSPP